MRSLLVIITVVLLGVAPLGGLTVWAQEEPDEAWNNVARPTVGAPIEMLDELQSNLTALDAKEQASEVQSIREGLADNVASQTGYVISFLEPFAHIPEIPEAELMAVYVRSGEFIFDNMGPEPFTVIPGDDGKVSTVKIEGDDQVAYYTVNEDDSGLLQNEKNELCTGYCVVTPPIGAANEPRIALQLLAGDWVILLGGELCVWCLFNQHLAPDVTTGILYVFPLLPKGVNAEEFTWIEQWDAAPRPELQESSASATPDGSAQVDSQSGVMAWAFYNPAPNCRTG